MATPAGSITICTNSGSAVYDFDSDTIGGDYTFTVTSTGATATRGGSTWTYTYSGNEMFLGFATSINSSTVVYPVGQSYAQSTSGGSQAVAKTIYIVTVPVVTYKHMTDPNGNKIQVDSAIRDGNGVKIDTNYQKKHATATATLSSSSWSSNAQTVSVSGVTASNTVIVSPAPSSVSDYSSAGIYCSAQGSGTLTFTCTTAPTTNITVNIVILGV